LAFEIENRDVSGRAVDIFVPRDSGDLDIAASEMDGEVRRCGDFYRRSKITMRRIRY